MRMQTYIEGLTLELRRHVPVHNQEKYMVHIRGVLARGNQPLVMPISRIVGVQGDGDTVIHVLHNTGSLVDEGVGITIARFTAVVVITAIRTEGHDTVHAIYTGIRVFSIKDIGFFGPITDCPLAREVLGTVGAFSVHPHRKGEAYHSVTHTQRLEILKRP